MSRTREILAAVAVMLTLALPAAGQIVQEGNQTGLPPFGSFHGSNFDLVNVSNGNLHIEIPATSLAQRGGRTFTWRFIYDIPTWEVYWIPVEGPDPLAPGYWVVNPAQDEESGWRLANNFGWSAGNTLTEETCPNYPFLNYWVWSNYAVIEPDGTKHQMPFRKEGSGSPPANCLGQKLSGPALDGSGIVAEIDPSGHWITKVLFKDGSSGSLDTNGNIGDALGRAGVTVFNAPVTAYTSPLGFNVQGPAYTTWTIKNSSGGDKVHRIDYVARDIRTSFCSFFPMGQDTCFEMSNTKLLPEKLTLPNGKFYKFYWQNDGLGDLTRIDLPTGGNIEYTYGTLVSSPPPQERYDTRTGRRKVTARTVNADGQSHPWTYTGGTVRDPVGNETVHEFTFSVNGLDLSSAVETKVRRYAGTAASGTLLRTVQKDYTADLSPFFPLPANVRLIRETTTLDTGLTSVVETDYETFTFDYIPQQGWCSPCTATRLNVTERREWGFSAPLRRTTFAYLHTNNQPYLDRNIVDRVTTTQVYEGTTLKAQSTIEYDGYSTGGGEGIVAANAVQHDGTNYGTGFIYRGNVTAVKTWRDNPAAWFETRHLTYDTTGNILKTRDPGNHITTFNYDDSWGNATCAPSGNARVYLKSVTNALGHVSTSTYNSCTGTLASATDPNLQTTSSTYDAFDRPDLTTLPDGGQVDRDFDDDARIVTVKTKRTATEWLVSKAHHDQLGRAWRNELCEDGSPTCTQSIKTDTTFDALGRVWKVTNPYRSTGDPTYGITETLYDALGRVTKAIPPDGTAASNNILSTYLGHSVIVTDQAGKQRRSFTDAFGRLIQVDEPAGGAPASGSAGSATVNAATGGGVQVHNISAVQATASVTIEAANPSGAVQSVQEQSSPATQSTGSATVSGSLQSTQVQTQAGTAGTGSVAISGFTRSVIDYDNCWGPRRSDCPIIYDSGGVSITVNGFTATSPYGQGWTAASVASTLANVFNTNSGSPVTATVSTSTVYLTAKTTGTATNYSLSATSWSNAPAMFPILSYTAAPSGATLTGGQNPQYTTVYDSGTVSVTVNQGQPSAVTVAANYGQGSTAATVAASLRSALHATSLVNAGGTGATVTLTSEASGSGTNYPLAASWTYNSSQFSSPSFTAATSGMSGGADAQYTTVYDSGTVTITVNGVPKSVGYGQGSTKTTVAAALASAIAGDTGYPATASASGATVNLTARTAGTVGNSYALSASTTYNTSKFSQASFPPSPSGGALTGGVNGQTIYDSGTVTLTIAGCTPFTVNYQNGSTAGTVATALRNAIEASTCPVSASASGSQINLSSDGTGSSTNYALSWSATTNQSTYFSSPSFSLATSGMSGGANENPGSLATPAVTQYAYDTLDNLTCVVQKGTDTAAFTSCATASAAWRPRSFTYNSLSQLLTASNPESGAVTYTYDSDGNLLTKTDARGITTTHAYDALHRLTQKTYSDSTPAASYVYDQSVYWGAPLQNTVGRLIWFVAGSTGTQLSYDVLGRVSRQWQCNATCSVAYQIDAAYDLAGNPISLNYPSGRKVTYAYDTASRLKQVRFDSFSGTPVGYDYLVPTVDMYHAHGAPKVWTRGSGFIETNSYNNRLQPLQMRGAMGANVHFDKQYNFYDASGRNNGNVMRIADQLNGGRSQNFSYDELNRLDQAWTDANSGADCWGLDHGYDIWANLLSATVTKCSAPMLSVSVNAQNRISGFSYDAAGNLTADGSHTYQWDAESRMKSLDTTSAAYTYDANGNRVRKQVGSDSTEYIDFGGQVIAERDQAGVWTDYVFSGGRRLAKAPATAATSGTEYYHGDHLGSSRMMTNASATPIWSATYLPFGQEHNPQPTTNHYKFTGKERDPESNLDYFGARYYASTSARFLSPDWSPTPVTVPYADFGDPQTLNLYSYSSSPVVFADMDGHSTLKSQRQYAVAKAWEQERALVARTGQGTRPWTPEEKAELLRTGRVRGYEGHHINSVKGHPELARDPNNIKFVKGRAGNLRAHGGSFRNQTTGSLVARGFAVLQILDLMIQAVIANRSKEESVHTGFYEDIAGRVVITDLARAGQHLEAGTQINYGGIPGTSVGWLFTLQENGTWIDKDGNQLIQDKDGKFKVVGPEA